MNILKILDSLKLKSMRKYNDNEVERNACILKIIELCNKYNLQVNDYIIKEVQKEEVQEDDFQEDDFQIFKSEFYINHNGNHVYRHEGELSFYITIKVCINGSFGVFSKFETCFVNCLDEAYEQAYQMYLIYIKKYERESQEWF